MGEAAEPGRGAEQRAIGGRRRPSVAAIVTAVLLLAASLALGSSQAAAEDRPLPLRVPVGSSLVPFTVNIFENDVYTVDRFTGRVGGYCTVAAYPSIKREHARYIERNNDGTESAQFWMENTIFDPKTGETYQRGQNLLFGTWHDSAVYPYAAAGYIPLKPNDWGPPPGELAYYNPNLIETGRGMFDEADSECGPAARAERRERLRSWVASEIWWSDGPPRVPQLQATLARVGGDGGPIDVGEHIQVRATLTNTTDQPLTNLRLLSLSSNGRRTVHSGPTWTAPKTLEPDQTVSIQWEVSFDSVGDQYLEVRSDAQQGSTNANGRASISLSVEPPIDLTVESEQKPGTAVGDEFGVTVTATSRWDQPVEAMTPYDLQTPPGVASVTSLPKLPNGADPPSRGLDLPAGGSVSWRYQVRLDDDVFPAELKAIVKGEDPSSATSFTLDGTSTVDTGLEVSVTGERSEGQLIVTTKVHNSSGEPVTDLTTSDLVVEPVEDPDAGTPLPIPIGDGERTGTLPTSLGIDEDVELTTRFPIEQEGAAVLTELIEGQGSAGEVSGKDVVSIEVDEGDVTVEQAEETVRDGLRDSLRTLDETNDGITDQLIADQVAAGGTSTTPMSPELRANVDSWKAAGFSEEWATSLAVWEAEREHFGERMDATWDGFKKQASARGASAQKTGAAFLATISDADKVEMIVTDLWNGGIENLGYLGDVSSMSGPELMETALPANKALAAKVKQDLLLAYQGQRQLWNLEDQEFKADPRSANVKIGNRQGGHLANGLIDASIAVVGEGAAQASSKLVGSLLRSQGMGLDVGMSTSRIDPSDGLDGTADLVGDPAARLARLEQANRDSLQGLPTGTVIELDDLFGARTGMAPDDAAFFQDVAASMERDFPEIGDFVIQFRTAEPSTIDLPGALGKEEWNAYKAVGALDEAIGGPRALRGQVGVFPPTPLSQDALDALEATNPGFTKSYAERFATQQKNWDEFNSGTGSVNTILAGSQRHGPVRIINGRPGYPNEGVTYLEQLDEPEFIASRGLSEADVTALRGRLERHPGLTEPTELLAQPLGDAVGFARKMPDGSIRPYGSDYDLQYFGPADGVWPPGKRGQIITEFMRRVGKNPRVPAHGASDLGFDLDSQYFKKLAEYIMLPVHPTAAAAKAEGLLTRAKQIARDLRLQADAIEATNPARATAMRTNADKLDAITLDELKAFAKGEKVIQITEGDIRVGRGN